MRHEHATHDAKGWLAGPWDGDLQVSVGFATEAIDEPHRHSTIAEIYLVAKGSATARVETDTVELSAGDVLIVDPGEAHTFLASSEDYFHFVVHSPGLAGKEAEREKQVVSRSRRGL